jgi:hypothetical protein
MYIYIHIEYMGVEVSAISLNRQKSTVFATYKGNLVSLYIGQLVVHTFDVIMMMFT